MTKRPLLLLAVLLAPALATAPRDTRAPGARTELATIVERCRAEGASQGLAGWALVDHATELVHDAYTRHSLWHLWESPAQSLRRGRGWSAQYNQALAQVLRQLGFRVEVVHAARVRGLGHNPWWQAGHTWLRVHHDGQVLDVCAGRAGNRAGRVGFHPVTPVRPIHRWTRATVSTFMAPLVAVQAWRQALGSPVPRWLYRDFDDPL